MNVNNYEFPDPTLYLVLTKKEMKIRDNPQTPYQRILSSPHIHPSVKQSLTQRLETLNPFVLRKTTKKKLKTIFNSCTARHPSTNDPPPGNIYL
jgi:hypothetical protein